MTAILGALATTLATSFVATAAQDFSTVFESYQGYPNCYRQPILLQTTPGSLVAIAEGRNISYCSGTDWPDVVDFPIVSRVSHDFGTTWGQQVQITHGNLDFLTAVYDIADASVHLMIQYGDNGTVYYKSLDSGVSWDSVGVVNIVTGPEIVTVIPGCGHGIQISSQHCLAPNCAGDAGRLLLPFVCTTAGDVSNDTACGNCHTCLLASDDHGATWTLGAVSDQNGSREAALLQLDSAVARTVGAAIYAGERNLGNATGSRWHALSRDAGRSFDPSQYAYDSGLPDGVTANWTGVVSGYARVDGAAGLTTLVFTAPADRTARQRLSAFASTDQGATWSTTPLLLWPGPSAYSDLIALNSTHVAVLFENGDVGSQDFAMRISFGIVAVADVISH